MDGKRGRLLLMKRTQPGKICRPGLLELHILAHNADNVRLLLYRVCKISRIGHEKEPLSIIAAEKNKLPRVDDSKSGGIDGCLCFDSSGLLLLMSSSKNEILRTAKRLTISNVQIQNPTTLEGHVRIMATGTRINYDEFRKLQDAAEETIRYELDEGELIVVPPPTPLHNIVRYRLRRALTDFVLANNLGIILDETDFRLAPNVVRKPDIAYLAKDHLKNAGSSPHASRGPAHPCH
jgi:hypothetical protein